VPARSPARSRASTAWASPPPATIAPPAGSGRRLDRRGETTHGETTTPLLADLEHELRLPRHPVRLGAADGQHERHLRVPRGPGRPDPDALAGRAPHRPPRAAAHRHHERPHVGTAGTTASLLPRGRDPAL